ncbi:MAG: alpha-mannosidase, partial [Planctomycetes bacterium]|nr:alpha-mannosidase [Planctomycetota bacterium]
MIGIGDHDYIAIRFEAFATEVLGPAVHVQRADLELAVWQTTEPVPLAMAVAADYRPIAPGFRWGPVWSTAWFRIRGRVPAAMAGKAVALRFCSCTEALLWQDGAPRQGFDDNRDTCLLFTAAAGNENVELFVEAACLRPFGVSTFFWDPPEEHRRWQDQEPGRVAYCELVTVDTALWRLQQKLLFARQVALAVPPESARAHRLIRGLRLWLTRGDTEPAALLAREAELDELLRGAGGGTAATRCTAVGHAHIDTAWLWPVRETRRKLLRSWSNVLELMERHDDFCFVASQAQQYAFVERDAPALFERIRVRVAEGRWEAGGAMWVEPDCHAPSGESLVRQLLVGTRWFEDRFGARGRQRHLYLPDTFGFPASLPQLCALAGLDTFVTNKLVWSERTAFPHTTFRWRGIDGTEIVTHFTPGDDYNAQLQPAELRHGEQKLIRNDLREVQQTRSTVTRWLQPFGFGDGGGGPTAEAITRGRLAADCEGMPAVEPGTIDAFCTALHRERAAARAREGRDLPVWDGEFYLEKHRGTLTTAAWLKQANARAEQRLRVIETLLAGAGDAAARAAFGERLEACWQTVLLHQFHDILPGSSIAAVYDDARAAFAALDDELAAAEEAAFGALAARLGGCVDDGPAPSSWLLFNPCSHRRSGVVTVAGAPRWIADVPALGAVVVGAAEALPAAVAPVTTTANRLRNGLLAVTLDAAGRIAEFTAAGCDADALRGRDDHGGPLPLNQLVVYEDRPRRWEAWDVDFDYTDRGTELDGPVTIAVVEDGPLRGAIEVTHAFGHSRVVQRYVLAAGSRYLAIETEVDWQEEHAFLRALFPTGIRARAAT